MSIRADTPLLLLHGFPMDARMWRHTVSHFQPSRLVVAPNASALVADGGTTTAMAEAALSALDTKAPGSPAVVVGLSMGGYVAAEIARAHPDRVAGLVLCDTRVAAEPVEGRPGREAMIEATRRHGVTHGTAPLVSRLLHDPSRELMAEVQRIVDEQDVDVIIACIAAIRDRRDNSDVIRHLSVPYLVIAGEHDELAPQQVEEALASLNPRGRFTQIAKSGHLPPMENPEAFNAALETFLSQ